MDVDEQVNSEVDDEDDEIWSAIIECEACPAELYAPIRVSGSWVQERGDSAMVGNALDIPNTNLSWIEPADTHNSNDENKRPDVRFVAKLEPPVLVPLQTALQILESLGSPAPQETILPITYESLLFADTDPANILQHAPTPRSHEKTISSYDLGTGIPSDHQHKYTLYTSPQDFARTLDLLPFRHPMQIINLLPTFRQWALVSSILRRGFITQPLPPSSPTTSDPPHKTTQNDPIPNPTFQSLEDELAAFLSSPTKTIPAEAIRQIDISFTAATPLPQFQLQFANPKFSGKLASVQFSVGLNGVIEGLDVDDGRPPAPAAAVGAVNGAGVSNNSGSEDVDGKERVALREKVKKVLEISEDLGVVVEWLCRP